jgi:hypothetical protein
VFRVYYGDGSTYDGEVADAPALGVQVIVEPDARVGRVLWQRKDYYWFSDGHWSGGDIFGLFDYLARPGMKRVLFGRSVHAATFDDILQQAIDDPDFAPKSAWRDWEQA